MNQFLSGDPSTTLIVGLLAGGLVSAVGFVLFLWTRGSREEAAEPEAARPTKRDPFVHGSTSERRTSLRRKGTQVEVGVRDVDGRSELGTAWVIDRSMGGICLAVNDEFDPGQSINVRPLKGSQTAPWTTVEVRSCRRKDGRWELGCQFVRQPTWNVMMLFG